MIDIFRLGFTRNLNIKILFKNSTNVMKNQIIWFCWLFTSDLKVDAWKFNRMMEISLTKPEIPTVSRRANKLFSLFIYFNFISKSTDSKLFFFFRSFLKMVTFWCYVNFPPYFEMIDKMQLGHCSTGFAHRPTRLAKDSTREKKKTQAEDSFQSHLFTAICNFHADLSIFRCEKNGGLSKQIT